MELEEKINQTCRDNNVKFILSQTMGLISKTFVDLGDNFEVTDKDGEEILEIMIKDISREKDCLVELSENNKTALNEGDLVMLDQVVGPIEMNKKICKVIQ